MNWHLFLFLIFSASITWAADAPPAAVAGKVTLTPEMVERIKSVTGFGDDFPIVSARRVTAAEANTRQLALFLNNETGVAVTLRPDRLKLKHLTGEYADRYERRFTVFLNAEGSQVLAVKSTLPGRLSPEFDRLPADAAEVKARPRNPTYQTFPTVIPKMTFLEALSRDVSPFDSEEVEGVYIMYPIRDLAAPQPTWLITFRGTPFLGSRPFAPLGQPAHERQERRVDIVSLFDAMTGKGGMVSIGDYPILRSPP